MGYSKLEVGETQIAFVAAISLFITSYPKVSCAVALEAEWRRVLVCECVNVLVGNLSREGAKVAKDGDGTDSLATWQERSSVRGCEAKSVDAATAISAIVAKHTNPLFFFIALRSIPHLAKGEIS